MDFAILMMVETTQSHSPLTDRRTTFSFPIQITNWSFFNVDCSIAICHRIYTIYMKSTTIMAAVLLLLLGFVVITTNHAYACEYDCGLGLGLRFHTYHWGFYHWHWGIGFYHWPWHWGTPCCSTYEPMTLTPIGLHIWYCKCPLSRYILLYFHIYNVSHIRSLIALSV